VIQDTIAIRLNIIQCLKSVFRVALELRSRFGLFAWLSQCEIAIRTSTELGRSPPPSGATQFAAAVRAGAHNAVAPLAPQATQDLGRKVIGVWQKFCSCLIYLCRSTVSG
jgi:hypothetical protein